MQQNISWTPLTVHTEKSMMLVEAAARPPSACNACAGVQPVVHAAVCWRRDIQEWKYHFDTRVAQRVLTFDKSKVLLCWLCSL